jgi:hypothetical protein
MHGYTSWDIVTVTHLALPCNFAWEYLKSSSIAIIVGTVYDRTERLLIQYGGLVEENYSV